MKKVIKLFSNAMLATILLALILAPVGIVARIGGTTPLPQGGVALGARVNSLGKSLSEMKKGEIKELSFTTFWGQSATYHRALKIKNARRTHTEYQLEILSISGDYPERQEVSVCFQKTGTAQTNLGPGEEAWVNLEVTAPKVPGLTKTQSSLKLAIWER